MTTKTILYSISVDKKTYSCSTKINVFWLEDQEEIDVMQKQHRLQCQPVEKILTSVRLIQFFFLQNFKKQ